MTRRVDIPTARVFLPLLEGGRYKGVHGGRGSGKSHFVGGYVVEQHLANRGEATVCIREVQKSLAQSSKRLIEAKLAEFGLGEADGFKVFREVIETPGDGLIAFQGMQDHTAESIKSLEGFKRAWGEEAQTLSQHSLTLLRPTIRAPQSELVFTWNPRRKSDPVDKLLRGDGQPTGSIVVEANWSDNPWFPAELEQERLDDLRDRPDQYGHIWEGEYAKVTEGAYYAAALATARNEKRITDLTADPLMEVRAFWDIGTRDATAIWVAQFIGQKIVVLDYYEAVGQPLGAHLEWLRSNGYGKALCVLPHDGANTNHLTADKFEDHVRQAGFRVQTVANQGKGAALKRIEAARRLFPRVWIDQTKCASGLEALGAYHERKDEARGVGLGPNHDWSSHGADAFGLMCVAYDEPRVKREEGRPARRPSTPTSWMGA